MSMVLDGASPRSRKSDPVTSVDAGRAADLHGSQAAVLDLMRGPYTWTQAELERGIDRWSPSRIRSAVSELEARGLVEWTGETRPTRYGRQARVYRAVSP
jgi:SOS-response transcriptional repressor LexA